jgi:chromosome segregation ATPase
MDLPDFQRISEAVRDAVRGVPGARAVDQLADYLKETARRVQHLIPVAGRVETVESELQTHRRDLTELRSRLADLSGRLSKVEHLSATQARELSELRVRLHGTTARVVRLEEEAGHHIRELGELRARLDEVGEREPQVNLADVQRHLKENDQRLTAALAEIDRQITAARRSADARPAPGGPPPGQG